MFLKLEKLQHEKLQHVNSITHEGKVVVFAVTGDGQISYTIRQDGFEDNYGNTVQTGWENWKDLGLSDLAPDPSVAEKEADELTWG